MRFSGIRYPLVKDPRGYFNAQSGTKQIKGDLLSLLLTEKYERVMETDFGCGLNEWLFQQSVGIEELAREKIITAIERYEPRITIDNLEIVMDEDNHTLSIKISFFDPENINEIQELNLEVPLGTGDFQVE